MSVDLLCMGEPMLEFNQLPPQTDGSRQSERLEAQVNGLSPLVFFDTFPVPGGGFYGVLWSGEARLTRLEGWRRTTPWAAWPRRRWPRTRPASPTCSLASG